MRAIIGRPKALRSEAMVRGNSVYPMMETDCMKELGNVSTDHQLGCRENSHVAAEQFDLECNHSLAHPDQ
jgi:hypothetical protein